MPFREYVGNYKTGNPGDYIGKDGSLVVDTVTNQFFVHDGITPGGRAALLGPQPSITYSGTFQYCVMDYSGVSPQYMFPPSSVMIPAARPTLAGFGYSETGSGSLTSLSFDNI